MRDRLRSSPKYGRGVYWMVVAIACLFAVPGKVEESVLERFVEGFLCQTVDRLHAVAAMQGSAEERFIYISPRDALEKYIACFFLDDVTLQCEIASGYDKMGASVPKRMLPVLVVLGFTIDEVRGNHHRIVELATPEDFVVAAELMLTALHVVHGVDADANVIVATPGQSGDGPCSAGM